MAEKEGEVRRVGARGETGGGIGTCIQTGREAGSEQPTENGMEENPQLGPVPVDCIRVHAMRLSAQSLRATSRPRGAALMLFQSTVMLC